LRKIAKDLGIAIGNFRNLNLEVSSYSTPKPMHVNNEDVEGIEQPMPYIYTQVLH